MTGDFAQLVEGGVEQRILERLRDHRALESTQTERERDPLKSPVVQAGEDGPFVGTAFTFQPLHVRKVKYPGESFRASGAGSKRGPPWPARIAGRIA